MTRLHFCAALAVLALVPACAAEPDDGARLAINVAPFEIEAVTNARYQLTVRNAADEIVWTREVDAAAYGTVGGSLSYVGPCDAQSNPNSVTLEVLDLYNASSVVDPGIYEAPGPITRSVTCEANQDTSVEFDITILIDPPHTTQFVNIGVSFADIFCSAKLDCLDEDGDPLLLLHDANGDRAQTAVVALSCTAGAGADTVLYRDDLTIVCDDGQGTVLTTTVDPSAGPGKLEVGDGITGDAGVLFGASVSQGDEQLGYSKAYWNILLGLEPGAKGCRLTTTGTAHDGPFDSHTVPEGTVWPYIDWDVDLTNTDGDLVCSRHPVGGEDPNDGVSALYTDGSAVTWSYIYYRQGSVPAAPDIAGLLTAGDPGHWEDGVATSCEEYRHPVDGHTYTGSTGDGIYTIDPDGAGPIAAFDAYCDMTDDGGGWTLVSRHYNDEGLQNAAAVGVLSDPAQTTTAKLSDAVINALRPDFETAVFRLECGSTSYFQQDQAFAADQAGTATLLRCASTWNASTWYTGVQHSLHYGLNNWLVADPPGGTTNYALCGGYQIWDYSTTGCYPAGEGTTWVKGPVAGLRYLFGGGTVGDPRYWTDGSFAASCNAYLNPPTGYSYTGSTGDGVYAIDPDGDGTPIEAYCDMTTDGGGWTLTASVATRSAFWRPTSYTTSNSARVQTLGTPDLAQNYIMELGQWGDLFASRGASSEFRLTVQRVDNNQIATLGFLDGLQMNAAGEFLNNPSAARKGDGTVVSPPTSACVIQYESNFVSAIVNEAFDNTDGACTGFLGWNGGCGYTSMGHEGDYHQSAQNPGSFAHPCSLDLTYYCSSNRTTGPPSGTTYGCNYFGKWYWIR